MWLHTINRDKMGDIRNGWTAGVYPLDLNQGFKKDRVGVIEERNQFFWIVEQAATEATKMSAILKNRGPWNSFRGHFYI